MIDMPQDDRPVTLEEFEEQRRRYYGIPSGLAASLRQQESGGRQYDQGGSVLTSPKQAKGRYQVLKSTAAGYGLDPDDPFENVEASFRYLSDLNKQVDAKVTDPGERWAQTLAGYHAGEGRLREVNKTGALPDTSDGLIRTDEYVANIMNRWQQHDQGRSGQRQAQPVTQPAMPAPQVKPAQPKALAPAEQQRRNVLTGQIQALEDLKKRGDLAGAKTIAADLQKRFGDLVEVSADASGAPSVKARQKTGYLAPGAPTDTLPAPAPRGVTGAINQFIQSAIKGTAALPEGIAELVKALPHNDEIDAFNQLIYEGKTPEEAQRELPARLAEYKADRAQNRVVKEHFRPITEAGTQFAERFAPVDPTDQSWLTAKIPQALGSTVPLAIGTALTGGNPLTPAILGASMNAQQVAREFDAAGVPPEKRDRAILFAGATGLTEAFGLGRALNKFGLARQFIKRLADVAEEGGQEALQQYLNNVNAAVVSAYDPNRPFSKDVLENAVLGAVTGGVFHGVSAGAERIGGRGQGTEALTAPVDRGIIEAAAAPQAPRASAVTLKEGIAPPGASPEWFARREAARRDDTGTQAVRNYTDRIAEIEQQTPVGPEREAAIQQAREEYRTQRQGALSPEVQANLAQPETFTPLSRAGLNTVRTGPTPDLGAIVAPPSPFEGRKLLNPATGEEIVPEQPPPSRAVREVIARPDPRFAPSAQTAQTQALSPAAIQEQPTLTKAEQETQQRNRTIVASRGIADQAKREAETAEAQGRFADAREALKRHKLALSDLRRLIPPRSPGAVKLRDSLGQQIRETDDRLTRINRTLREQSRQPGGRQKPVDVNAPTAEIPRARAPLLEQINNLEGGVPPRTEPLSGAFGRAARKQERGEGEARDNIRIVARIRQLGGINPAGIYTGELQSAVDKKYPGLINRRDGVKPDTLRETLRDEGYPIGADLDSLFRAIDDDIAGKHVYPITRSRTEELASEETAYYARQEEELRRQETEGERRETEQVARDPLLDRAKQELASIGIDPASDRQGIAVLQRRLKIPYAHAERLREQVRAEARSSTPQSEAPRTERLRVPKATPENIEQLRDRRAKLDRLRYDRGDRLTGDLADEYQELGSRIANYDNEQAKAARGGRLEVGPPAGAPTDERPFQPATAEDRRRALETVEARLNTEIERRTGTLPQEDAEALEQGVAAIDALFGALDEDVDAAGLFNQAINGDTDAEAELRNYADKRHGIDGDTLDSIFDAARERRAGQGERTRGTTSQPETEPAQPSENRSAIETPTQAQVLSTQDLKTLNENPDEVTDEDFDQYRSELEDLNNRQILGRVDLPDWAQRQLEARLKQSAEVRRGRVKEKRLPARHAPLPAKAKPFSKEEGGRRLVEQAKKKEAEKPTEKAPETQPQAFSWNEWTKGAESFSDLMKRSDTETLKAAYRHAVERKQFFQDEQTARKKFGDLDPKELNPLIYDWEQARASIGAELQQRDRKARTKEPPAAKPEEPPTVVHPNPAIDRQPILAETNRGTVIIANPDNKTGVSEVKDHSDEPSDYKFSSTQVNLPPEIADQIIAFGKRIPDADLADDGREDTPHITVKFGLHGADPKFAREALAGEKPATVKFGKVSLFETNPDFDVVKVDIESPDLHRLNKKVAESQPVTDTHPTYQPHATIAYVKKGLGKKYVGDTFLEGKTATLDSVMFSGRDGEKVEIPLGSKTEPPVATGKSQAAQSNNWLKSLSDDQRERVFVVMRSLEDTVESAHNKMLKLRPPQGTIGVGSADFDPALKFESLSAFLRALNKGTQPDTALAEAKQLAREMIKNWNERGVKGRAGIVGKFEMRRWEGSADAYLDDAWRGVLNASNAPETSREDRPMASAQRASAAEPERSKYWDTPPVPRTPSGFLIPLTLEQRAEQFEYSRAEFRQHATRARVYANEQGAFTYAAAINKVVGNGDAIPIAIDGVAVPINGARKVIRYLLDRIAEKQSPARKEVYNNLAYALEQAVRAAERKGDKAITIINTEARMRNPEGGSRLSLEAVRQVAAHEETHVWQMNVGGLVRRGLFSDEAITSDPDYTQQRHALVRAGYSRNMSPDNVSAEAIAHVAAGQWRDLGYRSEGQAMKYLARVLDRAYTELGADAVRSLRLRTPKSKGVREDVEARRTDGGVGRGTRPGATARTVAGGEVRGTQTGLPGREGEERRSGEGAPGEVQGTQPTENRATLASVQRGQPAGPTEAPDQSGVRRGYVRMVDAKGKSYITEGKRGTRSPQPTAARAQNPLKQPALIEEPKSGRDVSWYDYLASPLSNLNYKGTYERLAGETGKEISEAFRRAQQAIAKDQKSRGTEIAKLERELRGYQKQLRAEGKPGLANWLDAHVAALQDPDSAFKGVVGFLKKFQYDWKLRHNPRSIIINFLQPLQTLWPHLSTAEFVKISAQARQKETRERVAELAARESGGKTEEVDRRKKRWLPDIFAKVSESNRIMGHLAGELMADRLGLTGAAKARMAADWAQKVEFDNSRWNVPPLFRGRFASVIGQFKPFTVKNLERLYADWKAQPEGSVSGKLARRAKIITGQLALGGVRSLLLPGIKEIGGVLILGGLAKALSASGMDDDDANKTAEALYFGAPGLIEQDLSSSVTLLDSPFGQTPSEKAINFLGGPTLSLIVKAWKEGETMANAKDSREQTRGEKIKASALRLGKAVSPYTKAAESVYSLATTGKPPKLRLGKEEVEMTKKEAIGYGLMGTPLRQTKYYEKEDAFDWQKRMLGEPDINRLSGDTDQTYRERAKRVEAWTDLYESQLLDHPRYKRMSESQQNATLETLRRRIATESNQRRPDLSKLSASDVIRSTMESERRKPARDRRKIVVAPD